MKKIKDGDTVTVNYTGKFEDGTIFDTSLIEGREPITAKIGEGKLIKGFEKGLINMAIGDTKTVEIESSEAYGDYNPNMVTEVEKNNLPDNIKIGDMLQGMTDKGPVVVKVIDIKENMVTIDANHPLAGKKLIFDLEVVGVE